MDPCTGLSVDPVFRLFEQSYERCPARLRFRKLYGRLHLRKHRARSKLPFLYILLCFFDAQIVEFLLIGLSKVDGNFLEKLRKQNYDSFGLLFFMEQMYQLM